VASGLAIPSSLAWSGVDAERRNLVVATSDGHWLGVDLVRGRPSFEFASDETSIHSELLAPAGEPLLACQTTPTSAWLRSPATGRTLDDFGVARTPITQVLAAGAPPEPVVLFDDGWLVALGPPEPESARLLADFLDRAAVLRDGAAVARAAGPGGR
jgi:hypothetical protein